MAHQIHDAKEKLSYYRRCADAAGRNANAATDPDIESAYFAIQRTWIYLADQLEREIAFAGDDLIIGPDDAFIPEAKKGPLYRSR